MKVVKQLAKQLGIDIFIEGYIGNVSQPQKISSVDLFSSLKEPIDLSKTILIDVIKS